MFSDAPAEVDLDRLDIRVAKLEKKKKSTSIRFLQNKGLRERMMLTCSGHIRPACGRCRTACTHRMVRSRAANSCSWPIQYPHATYAQLEVARDVLREHGGGQPYRVLFAWRNTSSSSSNLMTTQTGPNISSWTTRMSGCVWIFHACSETSLEDPQVLVAKLRSVGVNVGKFVHLYEELHPEVL